MLESPNPAFLSLRPLGLVLFRHAQQPPHRDYLKIDHNAIISSDSGITSSALWAPSPQGEGPSNRRRFLKSILEGRSRGY
jgi:hypothetical protein